MNYGLYVSASGALTSMHRLDVASNNLANVETVGFKPDFAMVRQRDVARIEDGLGYVDSKLMLEQLGGGVLMAPTATDHGAASARDTGNALDVAILGEGFFALDGGQGEGDARLRFTRDGRFTLNSRGRLVHVATGHAVLDDRGRPIDLDPTLPTAIGNDGTITQNGEPVARIQVTSVADPSVLEKRGENVFAFGAGKSSERRASDSLVRSGALENSGVEAIRAMLAVSKASGDAQSNTRMIRLHDEIMGRAINNFGRIG